jgi:hypothetical protein
VLKLRLKSQKAGLLQHYHPPQTAKRVQSHTVISGRNGEINMIKRCAHRGYAVRMHNASSAAEIYLHRSVCIRVLKGK